MLEHIFGYTHDNLIEVHIQYFFGTSLVRFRFNFSSL